MKNQNNTDFNYRVVYSRRRSIGISVGPDTGVTVHAPLRTSLTTIEKLVIAKSAWISKHLENYKSSVRINNNKVFKDGSVAMFRGKEHPVRLIISDKYSVRLHGEIIEIGLKDLSQNEIAARILEKWFRITAENLFREKFSFLLAKYKQYDFRPSDFTVRSLKRRWGSCTSKGKITISSELIKLDEIYLEYVILHELCHLRHHNHGKEFYRLLSEVFPGWKMVRSELKRYIR